MEIKRSLGLFLLARKCGQSAIPTAEEANEPFWAVYFLLNIVTQSQEKRPKTRRPRSWDDKVSPQLMAEGLSGKEGISLEISFP